MSKLSTIIRLKAQILVGNNCHFEITLVVADVEVRTKIHATMAEPNLF
jgi:hypothetical protein